MLNQCWLIFKEQTDLQPIHFAWLVSTTHFLHRDFFVLDHSNLLQIRAESPETRIHAEELLRRLHLCNARIRHPQNAEPQTLDPPIRNYWRWKRWQSIPGDWIRREGLDFGFGWVDSKVQTSLHGQSFFTGETNPEVCKVVSSSSCLFAQQESDTLRFETSEHFTWCWQQHQDCRLRECLDVLRRRRHSSESQRHLRILGARMP